MSQPSRLPPQLARFPAAVLEAYERYRTQGDAEGVTAVVMAAVMDYIPTKKGEEGLSDLASGTRLVADLGYDSVAIAELVFFLEDLFDLTISNAEIQSVRTIGELRECVARKMASSLGASSG